MGRPSFGNGLMSAVLRKIGSGMRYRLSKLPSRGVGDLVVLNLRNGMELMLARQNPGAKKGDQ